MGTPIGSLKPLILHRISCAYLVANRHGLIAGATGTGKTVTLKVLASASRIGVPVFLADAKGGDVSSLAKPGESNPNLRTY